MKYRDKKRRRRGCRCFNHEREREKEGGGHVCRGVVYVRGASVSCASSAPLFLFRETAAASSRAAEMIAPARPPERENEGERIDAARYATRSINPFLLLLSPPAAVLCLGWFGARERASEGTRDGEVPRRLNEARRSVVSDLFQRYGLSPLPSHNTVSPRY